MSEECNCGLPKHGPGDHHPLCAFKSRAGEVIAADREAVETLAHRFYDAARPDCAIPYYVAERLAALAHLPNTDLSEERAREVLAECGVIVADYGGLAHSGNVLPGAAVLRAMHHYAAGLQGEVERLRKALLDAADGFDDHADHAQNRIEDGDEMGEAVWRIALGDIKREAVGNAKSVRSALGDTQS